MKALTTRQSAPLSETVFSSPQCKLGWMALAGTDQVCLLRHFLGGLFRKGSEGKRDTFRSLLAEILIR